MKGEFVNARLLVTVLGPSQGQVVECVLLPDAQLWVGGPLPKRWEDEDLRWELARYNGQVWMVRLRDDMRSSLDEPASPTQENELDPLRDKRVPIEGGREIPLMDTALILFDGVRIHLRVPVQDDPREGPSRVIVRPGAFVSCSVPR